MEKQIAKTGKPKTVGYNKKPGIKIFLEGYLKETKENAKEFGMKSVCLVR